MYELERKTPEIKRGRSKSVGKNLRLGERDFLILRFILEMKFCSAEQIWERFFRYADEAGGTIKYTQNRLSRLRRGEYLNSHFTYDGPVRYYTATAKAFDLVLNHFDLRDKDMPEPSKLIDMRSFTHDKGLVWLRVFFENMGLVDAFSWESEGCIKRRTLFGLKPEIIKERMQNSVWPDALVKFKAAKGDDPYALELEHTIKGPERRREKIQALWRADTYTKIWKRKLFIFSNPQVERAYAESFNDFFGKAANGKNQHGHEKSISELEENFFEQVFMVANYSEVREKYEKFLSGEERGAIEVGAICSVEPRFLEIREKVKVLLYEEQLRKEQAAKNDKEWQEKNAMREQQKRAEEEKQKKGIFGGIFN